MNWAICEGQAYGLPCWHGCGEPSKVLETDNELNQLGLPCNFCNMVFRIDE